MFNDDRLLKNPDQVASDEDISWATAFWYWKRFVGVLPQVKNGFFGSSTRAINGFLECAGDNKNLDKALKRFAIYKNVLTAFNLNEVPIEQGCYN